MSYLKDVVIISTLPYNKLAWFTEMDVMLQFRDKFVEGFLEKHLEILTH